MNLPGTTVLPESIKYVGVNDHDIDLFEGQYDVTENGMSYNSYVIMDEKPAVMDGVDANFVDEWLGNVEAALEGAQPAYLVVHHMEPDHSAGIVAFAEKYPEATIVASAPAFKMMGLYFGTDYAERREVVKEGSEIELGSHKLTFISAPNVHWPEVMFSYENSTKVLFSADAFGKFGALDYDDPEGWACEARRYYFGIVGKFGKNAQAALAKVANFDVQTIAPLHGPVLSENLSYYLDTYNTWSSYGVESEGVCIAYSSVYGHVEEAAKLLKEELEAAGCPKVAIADLAREDMAETVEDAFRYGKLVCASITYQGGIFPHMATFIHTLAEHNYQKRTVAFIEGCSWAPAAAKTMRAEFEAMSDIALAETTVTVRGALDGDARAALKALAKELV